MKVDGITIAVATGGEVVRDAPAGDVLTDTRSLGPGSWFLALKGDRFDGHRFLEAAEAAGAVGCVVSEAVPGWTGGIVRVEDTTKALQDLGRHARSTWQCPVVGLTGSSGKTTTRALTALALSPLGEVHQTKGNLNNHLGVPMTLLAGPVDPAAVVVEMGTSSPGEIGFLCDIAQPTVRLIVNVGPAHLEELGGLDGVATEKGAIFATARAGDILCVNIDDPYVAAMPRPPGTCVVTWGRSDGAAVQLIDLEVDGEAMTARARYDVAGEQVEICLPTPAPHVALDAAGALAVALACGVDARAAAAAMEGYAPVGMRLRVEEPLPGVTVLNDAYNANPASMKAALSVLAGLPGRRVAVLGDMLELGPDELAWHRDVITAAEESGLDLVVLAGERMSTVAESVPPAGERWVTSPLEAGRRLAGWLRAGDRVLLKGSRGARVEQVLLGMTGSAPAEADH